MKYLWIVLISIVLIACDGKNDGVSQDETVISGSITSFPSRIITITKDNKYDLDYDFDVLATTEVDDLGKFSLKIDIDKPEIVQFRLGEQLLLNHVYVNPGEELILEIENKNPANMLYVFSGEPAKANRFHLEIEKQFPKGPEFDANMSEKDFEIFSEWIDNRRQEMLNYYENYFFEDTVPALVNVSEISKINYEWASSRNEWALLHHYYRPETWNTEKLPDNFWMFLKNINFGEPYLHLFLERYLESLTWQWHINQVAENKTPTVQEMEMARFELAKSKFSGESRDLAMSVCINGILAFQFDERLVGVLRSIMEDFKQQINDKNYIPTLETKFKKRLSLLKGEPAPDFTLENDFEVPISLSDLKGNIVYITIWSTMYPLSKDLLKQLFEVKEQFKERTDIKFLTIALENNNREGWKTTLNDIKLDAVNLYADGEFSNPMAMQYMINSLPTFIIIDKEGKIVSLKAPYPKSKDFGKLLETLK